MQIPRARAPCFPPGRPFSSAPCPSSCRRNSEPEGRFLRSPRLSPHRPTDRSVRYGGAWLTYSQAVLQGPRAREARPQGGGFTAECRQALALAGDGHLEGRGVRCPGDPGWEAWGVRARKEGAGGGGGLWRGGREALPPAHLCNHADAPHDDGGFGLSPTHSAEPGGDEDLPGQVLDAQVPPPGIQHGELQGEDSGSRSTPACPPPGPWAGVARLSPLCRGRCPGDQCSSNCPLSSGRTCPQRGKRGEPVPGAPLHRA